MPKAWMNLRKEDVILASRPISKMLNYLSWAIHDCFRYKSDFRTETPHTKLED